MRTFAVSALCAAIALADGHDNHMPRCFIDPVYHNIMEIRADSLPYQNIQYGSNFNRITNKQEDLYLDIYMPPDLD